MPVADFQKWIIHGRKIAGNNQRSHAGAVRLEGDGDQVAHQARVVAQIFRQAVLWAVHRKGRAVALLGELVRLVFGFAHALHALLYFADAGQIFVQFGFVIRAHLAAERLGAILHPVENAHVAQTAAILKQVIEGERGVDLHRHRRIRRLPRDVRAVGQRVVGFVIAGHGLLASQYDTGLRRVLANRIGDHLIHGDAGTNDGSFLKVRTGKQAARLRRVDAQTDGTLVEQTINHVDFMLQRFQRRQRLAQLHGSARPFGAPMILIDAVPHEHYRKAFGECLGRGLGHRS